MICSADAFQMPFADNCIDAIVTDPPYGLEFMGKEWDKLAKPKPGNLGGFADGNKPSFERIRKHLSGMRVWHTAWAREALRVLKPGGHLLAFGGTRTYHHLASGIEEAGFEVRDMVHWTNEQAGERTSGAFSGTRKSDKTRNVFGAFAGNQGYPRDGDTGSVSPVFLVENGSLKMHRCLLQGKGNNNVPEENCRTPLRSPHD